LPRKQNDPVLGADWDPLTEGARSLGLNLSQKQIGNFSCYLSLLLSWNAKFNLTAIRSPAAIIRLHFIDSLALAPFISPNGRILDVGSGAGFPGIPLKIYAPKLNLLLVEAHRRKANFLREVVRSLNLTGVEVIEGRAEKLSSEDVGQFNEVVTRALGSLDNFLRISMPLLYTGGRSIIMHGPKGAELFRHMEAQQLNLPYSECRLEDYQLPFGGEKRTLLIYVKR
jgi:16S rRNA (guanine527-N7)-methyltransferase